MFNNIIYCLFKLDLLVSFILSNLSNKLKKKRRTKADIILISFRLQTGTLSNGFVLYTDNGVNKRNEFIKFKRKKKIQVKWQELCKKLARMF